MDNLEKRDYFEHVDFYLDDDNNSSLSGDVYINEDSFCEGIVVDNENNSYFLFGIFKKFDSLDLYVVISDNEIFQYNGKKVMVRYEGEYSLMNGDGLSSFSMKSSSLEVDPRDYLDGDNPKEKFRRSLRVFKDNWLSNDKNNELYNGFVSNLVNSKINK